MSATILELELDSSLLQEQMHFTLGSSHQPHVLAFSTAYNPHPETFMIWSIVLLCCHSKMPLKQIEIHLSQYVGVWEGVGVQCQELARLGHWLWLPSFLLYKWLLSHHHFITSLHAHTQNDFSPSCLCKLSNSI